MPTVLDPVRRVIVARMPRPFLVTDPVVGSAAPEQVVPRPTGGFDQSSAVPAGGARPVPAPSGAGATVGGRLPVADAASDDSKRAGGGRFAVAS